MQWTRRKWMLAAGVMPLQFKAMAAALAAQAPGGRRDGAPEAPPVTLGPPPALPDKASFPAIKGTYLNSAGSHPMSAGSIALFKRAAAAQVGESG